MKGAGLLWPGWNTLGKWSNGRPRLIFTQNVTMTMQWDIHHPLAVEILFLLVLLLSTLTSTFKMNRDRGPTSLGHMIINYKKFSLNETIEHTRRERALRTSAKG